jgi:helix-turn-helix protein
MLDVAPHRRVVGEYRGQVAVAFAEEYQRGASIRDIAAGSGRSYGFVHRVLNEAGVAIRPRGSGARFPRATRTETV